LKLTAHYIDKDSKKLYIKYIIVKRKQNTEPKNSAK